MKKPSTTTVRRMKKLQNRQLTIGLDLGDRSSFYCVLNGAGEVVLETKVATNLEAMKKTFAKMARSGITSPQIVRPSLVAKYVRAKQQTSRAKRTSHSFNPNGLSYGGSVCDITNYTPACIFEGAGNGEQRYSGDGALGVYRIGHDSQCDSWSRVCGSRSVGREGYENHRAAALQGARRCLRHSEPSKLRATVRKCTVVDVRPDLVDPLSGER